MTDQIEKWREEFHELIGQEAIIDRSDSGDYFSGWTNSRWHGFLMAKRNMPVVELPKPELCFTSSPRWHGSFAYVQLEPLIERLEKAGIEWISENPYSVKGE
jgi:hypothetical protein